MRYLKSFETNEHKTPDVGDFILIKYNSINPGVSEFINNFPAKILKIRYGWFTFGYKFVPDDISIHFNKEGDYYIYDIDLRVSDDILEFGRTIEELYLKLDTKKYNL